MTPPSSLPRSLLVYLVKGRGQGRGHTPRVRRRAEPRGPGEPDPRPQDDRDPRPRRRLAASSGIAARAGASPERVGPSRRRMSATKRYGALLGLRIEPSGPDEVRTRVAPRFGYARQQPLTLGVVERQVARSRPRSRRAQRHAPRSGRTGTRRRRAARAASWQKLRLELGRDAAAAGERLKHEHGVRDRDALEILVTRLEGFEDLLDCFDVADDVFRGDERERVADLTREGRVRAGVVGVWSNVVPLSERGEGECGGVAADRGVGLGRTDLECPARIVGGALPVAGEDPRLDRADRPAPTRPAGRAPSSLGTARPSERTTRRRLRRPSALSAPPRRLRFPFRVSCRCRFQDRREAAPHRPRSARAPAHATPPNQASTQNRHSERREFGYAATSAARPHSVNKRARHS